MPFQPGTSGNPGGSRRHKPFYDALRMQIAAAGDDHRALRRVAAALIAAAQSGNVAAISALADRLDGKVPQATGQSDELGPQRLHISWRSGEPGERVVTVSNPLLLAPPEEEAA
jgi:hypothetical protein